MQKEESFFHRVFKKIKEENECEMCAKRRKVSFHSMQCRLFLFPKNKKITYRCGGEGSNELRVNLLHHERRVAVIGCERTKRQQRMQLDIVIPCSRRRGGGGAWSQRKRIKILQEKRKRLRNFLDKKAVIRDKKNEIRSGRIESRTQYHALYHALHNTL